MGRIKRHVLMGLVIVLSFGLTASAGIAVQQSEPEHGQTATRPFKLVAAGQIDLATGEILFGGTATHLGLYTATGFLDPINFNILGSITAANGDTLNFTAAFSTGPLGQLEAAFDFDGGTGRFAAAAGSASGLVQLDPADFSFLITMFGSLDY